MAKYKAMPRREDGARIANAQGVTFGMMIRQLREKRNLSLRGASGEIGISPAYLSDLENDRRYPPVGEVLQKILSTYKVDADTEFAVMELIGLGRKEIAPDMADFLQKNQFARLVVRKLMQVDNVDALVMNSEEESISIITAIDSLISKGEGAKKFDADIED